MLLLLMLLFLVVTLVAWYLIDVDSFNKKLVVFPSPPSFFLLGHSFFFLHPPRGVMLTIYDLMLKYGYTLNLQIGPRKAMLITSDYKLIEFILTHKKLLKKSPQYDFLHRWLGSGLITNDGGAKWVKHRKILTPVFHFKILEDYLGVFHSAGEILVKKLENLVDKESVNIVPIISMCYLDIICESAMGISVNAQEDEETEYVRSVNEINRISAGLPNRQTSEDYQKELKAVRIIHDFANAVIKSKLDKLGQSEGTTKSDNGVNKRKSSLDLFLSEMDTQHLSLEDIREEVDTFMLAGHDTTAATTDFLIYNLSAHPDIQEKVYQEQKEIFKDDLNRPVANQDLRQMKYLELVIKETLRYHPTVPLIGRELQEDVLYDGQVLPKGLTIQLFSYALHRNPKFFPDPEKFDPTRFENYNGENPFAFIPFSAGPRNCIGQKYGMLSVKSIVSKLVRRFEFLPTDPPHITELKSEMSIASDNGIKVQIKKR